MEKKQPGSTEKMSVVLAELLGSAGAHSRNFARAVLDPTLDYDR